MIIAGPIHAELRSAINIKNALDHIHRLQKLGYCPTKVQQFRDYFELDKRDERDSTPTESDSEENSERGIMDRDLANQVCNSLRNAHTSSGLPPL
jgi:hypothetical protein